jgi:hypothetical protein
MKATLTTWKDDAGRTYFENHAPDACPFPEATWTFPEPPPALPAAPVRRPMPRYSTTTARRNRTTPRGLWARAASFLW